MFFGGAMAEEFSCGFQEVQYSTYLNPLENALKEREREREEMDHLMRPWKDLQMICAIR